MSSGVTRYGEGQLLAVPALHKDGRQISIEFSIQLLKDAAGQIEWVHASSRRPGGPMPDFKTPRGISSRSPVHTIQGRSAEESRPGGPEARS